MGTADIRDDVLQEMREEILPDPNMTIKNVVSTLCEAWLEDEVQLDDL